MEGSSTQGMGWFKSVLGRLAEMFQVPACPGSGWLSARMHDGDAAGWIFRQG